MQMHSCNCFSDWAEHFGQINCRYSGLGFRAYSSALHMNVYLVFFFSLLFFSPLCFLPACAFSSSLSKEMSNCDCINASKGSLGLCVFIMFVYMKLHLSFFLFFQFPYGSIITMNTGWDWGLVCLP